MTLRNVTLAAAVAALLASPFAWATDDAGDPPNMYAVSNLSCKDVMILGGHDRDAVISFLHGYLAGEAKKSEIDLTKLGHATDTFIDKCLDAPTEKALPTLKAAIGH